MTLRSALRGLAANEDLNFLLTNRIPRRFATRFMGWFSRIEQPLVRDLSMRIWRLLSDLDLAEAKATRFASLHDCFIRELKPGARPLDGDAGTLVSPSDAIVGAHGAIAGTRVFQVKGFPYALADLLGDATFCDAFRDGTFVTLRLTSAMYHRFHAPYDCRVEAVRYMSGDTWNVNPIALKRVEALFCKNERAALRLRLEPSGATVALVPVAAILVASLRFRFLDADLRSGASRTFACDARLCKGEEMGWFEHGSTIVVLAPAGFRLCSDVVEGRRIKMGEALLRLPGADAAVATRA